MPSASSTPATEPHWREESKLDELLRIARLLEDKATEPRPELPALVLTAGTRLCVFPSIRRDPNFHAGSIGQTRFQFGQYPTPFYLELFGSGENELAMRFGCASFLSPLFQWELFS